MEAVSALRRATIAPVDEPLALEAADLSLAHGLAMADSLVYATARRFRRRSSPATPTSRASPAPSSFADLRASPLASFLLRITASGARRLSAPARPPRAAGTAT